MGFTCILKANIFLVGRYLDLLIDVDMSLRLVFISMLFPKIRTIFFQSHRLLSNITIVEPMTGGEKDMNRVESAILHPQKEIGRAWYSNLLFPSPVSVPDCATVVRIIYQTFSRTLCFSTRLCKF